MKYNTYKIGDQVIIKGSTFGYPVEVHTIKRFITYTKDSVLGVVLRASKFIWNIKDIKHYKPVEHFENTAKNTYNANTIRSKRV